MSLDSGNVDVAVTGAVSVGNDSATAPTSHNSTLTNYDDLGYVSDAGVTEARSRSTNDIVAWQNGDTVRTVVTSSVMTFRCVLLETKRETIEVYYGTEVDPDDGSLIIVPSETGGRRKYVFDYEDGDKMVRAYAPAGEVTEVGDQVWASGEPVGYEVTITCYPDSSLVDEGTGKTGAVKKWFSELIEAS